MRRSLSGIAGLAVVVSLSVAASSPAAVEPSRALLRGFICQPAVAPAQREVYVQAVMRPQLGGIKMRVRFGLLRRAANQRAFSVVAGADLGKWISPLDPTLGQRPADEWIVDHPVVGLSAPAAYRVRVTFRWLTAENHALATEVLLSPTCSQPVLKKPARRVAETLAMRSEHARYTH